MRTAETLAKDLGARRCGGYWMAPCVAHDDREPSLKIAENNGKLLLKCFAGCTWDALMNALRERGSWPDEPNRERTPSNSTIVATYDYRHADGQLAYQVVRKEPKRFLQRYPDGHGGWIWKKHPKQLLYRLPEVIEASILFVVEGEKDVETLRVHGFVATTNAGGANSPWLPSYTEVLHGREVIIIPDNDPPGWRRARQIAVHLLPFAAAVRLVELDGAKDISEWFDQGHSEVELLSALEAKCV
ncbi:MAG TPA: hypothetical protein VEX68_04775 [Bryobacteraceae bacterium]|nr:hypothetical protein [Bryobacteraceae bacterium]